MNVVSVEGTEARCRGSVDELGEAQLEDLFGGDWTRPTMTMFGAAVRDFLLVQA